MAHWDGSTWKAMPAVGTVDFWDIWGSGPSDIWAVNDAGEAFHWNGAAWTASDSGLSGRISSVWGSGSTTWIASAYGLLRH
jgi:hypothetical protein